MIYLGLDIGSTAVKAVAIDEKGNILSRGKCAYPTEVTGVKSTQNADDWWESAVSAVRQTVSLLDNPKDICAICISAQGGSILALDRDYKPLTRAMTWMDRRSTAEAEEISRDFGERVYRACGWSVSPAACNSKLIWLKKNHPDIFSKTAKFATTEEYINFKLTGKLVTDPSGAAITRLYNINTRKWDSDMLAFIGIDEEMLPRVIHSGAEIGCLLDKAAREMGIHSNITVYNGAHDQYCASIGSGVINPGDILLATGTAWVIFGVTEEVHFNEKHIAPGIHPVDGRFGAMVSLSGIGATMESYANKTGETLKELDKIAATRLKNAEELLICPCTPGRCFIPHRDIFGKESGYSDKNDRYDRALALMEGGAFEVRLAVKEFENQGIMKSRTLTMSGGAAKSELWSSLVGYVSDTDVMLTDEPDTPALGAAMIAAVNAGAFSDYLSCASVCVRKNPLAQVNTEIRNFYLSKFKRYCNWCIE